MSSDDTVPRTEACHLPFMLGATDRDVSLPFMLGATNRDCFLIASHDS